MRRAARYLAISSKKSMCALKKNDEARRERVDVEPGRERELDVREPVARRVNASSCAAVEPASRMW